MKNFSFHFWFTPQGLGEQEVHRRFTEITDSLGLGRPKPFRYGDSFQVYRPKPRLSLDLSIFYRRITPCAPLEYQDGCQITVKGFGKVPSPEVYAIIERVLLEFDVHRGYLWTESLRDAARDNRKDPLATPEPMLPKLSGWAGGIPKPQYGLIGAWTYVGERFYPTLCAALLQGNYPEVSAAPKGLWVKTGDWTLDGATNLARMKTFWGAFWERSGLDPARLPGALGGGGPATMSYDLYFQLPAEAAPEARERIARFLDENPKAKEWEYNNPATGVEGVFALDDNLLLTLRVNLNRPGFFLRELLDQVDEFHHAWPLQMQDPRCANADEAPFIPYARQVIEAHWHSANDWAWSAYAASESIAPERVMDDAVLHESWRWNYSHEMAAQLWGSVGKRFERMPIYYIVHRGKAARLAQWTGVSAVLPQSDVVFITRSEQPPCAVEYEELIRQLGDRATRNQEGVEFTWKKMPEDLQAFLRAQPDLTGQFRGLRSWELVEASVAQRLQHGAKP